MRKRVWILTILSISIISLSACARPKGKPLSSMVFHLEASEESPAFTDSHEIQTGEGASFEQDKQNEISKDNAVVTHDPEVVTPGSTFIGKAPLEIIEFSVPDPMNKENLQTEKQSFAFGAAKDGAPNQITVDNQAYFDGLQVGAVAWDNKTEDKILYLSFDCGYEYGTLTSDMLDVLKEKEVSAAFFCTLDYLETAPEVVSRMISEGHIVANHSSTHPADSSILSREELAWEILGVDNYLRANFGYTSPYFRFPAGVYSENALDLVYDLGYKSIFWSIAYADWDPEDQPGVDKSFQILTERLHPGAVILLHSTSPDNAAILGDFIDYAREQGYEFHTLDEYPRPEE